MLPPLNEATRQSSVPDVERGVEFLDTDIKSLDADSEFHQSACGDDPFVMAMPVDCVSYLSGRLPINIVSLCSHPIEKLRV